MSALIAGLLWPMTAGARPLDKETCEKLAGERVELARQGIEKAIVKGPEWTRASMPEGTLSRVRRYLVVEEQLRFQCPGARLPDLAPEVTAQDAAPNAEPDKKAAVAERAPETAREPEMGDTAATPIGIPLPARRPAAPARRFSPAAKKTPKKKAPQTAEPSLHRQLFRPGDRP